MHRATRLIVFVFAMAIAQIGLAAVTAPAPTPKPAAGGMTVAVFDFDGREPALQETGRLVAEQVRAKLGQGGWRVVSREETSKILEKQKLKIPEITDEVAPRLGALLGAQVVVTGRIFDSTGQTLATSKAIGAETGRVYTTVARGERAQDDRLGQDLGEKMLALINKGAESFVARIKLSDEQMTKLKKDIGNGPMPRVFVAIRESVTSATLADRAAQTEFCYILRKVGSDIAKDQMAMMREWLQSYSTKGSHTAPPRITNADIVVVGESKSQAPTLAGKLVSCRAVVELEAIDIKTGKVLSADRETYTATDVSRALAAQSALAQASGRLAYRMLPDAIPAWRAAQSNQKASAKDAATTRTMKKLN